MRINFFLLLSFLGLSLLILSFFLPYYTGAEGFGLNPSNYAPGYWPHILPSESFPIFDGDSLAYRFIILEVIGILITFIGLVQMIFNRKQIIISNDGLSFLGGAVSLAGVCLAISYGLNTYKLGWVQIYANEIGLWVALIGGMLVIFGTALNKGYSKFGTRFGTRTPEPVLFHEMANKKDEFTRARSFSNHKNRNGQIRESTTRGICSSCGKAIPKKVTQCPHCFEKILL